MNTRPQIKLEKGESKQKQVGWVNVLYNQNIITRLNESTPARWRNTQKCWYILKEEFEPGPFFEW